MSVLLAVLLGSVMVLQSTLNRRMADVWGLGGAVAMTTVVFCAVCAVFVLVLRLWPELFPAFYRLKGSISDFSPWFLLPGLFGVIIVLFAPLAIFHLGAAQAFVLIVGAQMIVSLGWDLAFEGQAFSWTRASGAGLALLGAWLASR